MALAADAASARYGVDIIFTAPITDIRRIAKATRHLYIFAPHMDPISPGRGLADILPESIKAAGAVGVMLNHCEKPLTLSVLSQTIQRAEALNLITIVCTDSIAEARAVAQLGPDIIVAEPTELIGSGKTSDMGYVKASIAAIKEICPDIMVLQGAGISCGEDVFRTIRAGAEATGSSSGIVKAEDPAAMIDEMIAAVREAWTQRMKNGQTVVE